MKDRGLELSPEKTRITHIKDSFDFLGQNVRDYNGTVLIQPSRTNVTTFLDKIRAVVKKHLHATPGQLIVQLNPMIRGWANYHRHVASKQTFNEVDHAIFWSLWRWARRRHPDKSRRWIKDRYFQAVGDEGWVFRGAVADREGQPLRVRLFKASRVPIQRHPKIKGAANPYDPEWELYFEERLGVKMSRSLRGRGMLLYLWKEQAGLCPVCHQKITTETGWHNHHIRGRTHGGPDTLDNRVLVHPTCHEQIHSRGLTVGKPAS